MTMNKASTAMHRLMLRFQKGHQGIFSLIFLLTGTSDLLTPLHNAERNSSQSTPTISTIVLVISFVYILTSHMVDRIAACQCVARCARGQYKEIVNLYRFKLLFSKLS